MIELSLTAQERDILLEALTRHSAYLKIYEKEVLNNTSCSKDRKRAVVNKALLVKGIIRMLRDSEGK